VAKEIIVLSLNCGSSSVKYQLYNWDKKEIMAKGLVERVTVGGSYIVHEVPHREPHKHEKDCPNHELAIKLIIDTLLHENHPVLTDIKQITAVGHRVVHGGEQFAKSTLITPEVIAAFEQLYSLAPLHNPPNVLGIRAAQAILPDVPHVAVMDTAFHQTMPTTSYIYAVPYEWYEKYGVRRYGFHGTSHLYVAKRAAVLLKKRTFEVNLVTCHIGNGVSLAAIKNGSSHDTSLGMATIEGLVMGTRSGDVDPAIMPYICEKEGKTAKEVEAIYLKKSGLLGISGKYTDRRDIEQAMDAGDARSKFAFEIECYRLRKYIGAYYAALGRLDAVVFTGGAGEMGRRLRAGAVGGLEPMGIALDPERNQAAKSRNHEFEISADSSRVKVFVIPTDEELVFTEDVVAIIERRYDVHTKFTYSFEDPSYVNRMREEAYQRELEKKKQK
jgi:acetate kinase